LRTAVIFLLAAVAASAVGVLTWLAGRSLPEAVLTATVASAGATTFFDQLVN
jgi:hypothetical protein